MCGLVGIAGNIYQRDAKVFRDMLVFDQVRGFDSTGVAMVPANGKFPVVEKELDGPDNLWNWGKSNLLDLRGIAKGSQKVIIGHNRAATIGDVTVENAHPFTFDNITGCHNGTLDYWYDLEKDEKGQRFDIDSKALLKTIAVRGIEDTWKSFYGAAALVWWDSDEGTMNFIRNEERPLYFGWNEKEDILLWASEDWMIQVAAHRHNMKLKTHTEETMVNGVKSKRSFKICDTKTDTYYKFKVEANGVELLEERKLEKKTWASATPTVRGSGWKTTQDSGGGLGDRNKQINPNWAKKLEKAGKEQVGRIFQFKNTVHNYINDKYNPYIIGQFIDGNCERIEVFPKTLGEFEDFLEENESTKNYYRLDCRPRIDVDYQKKFWGFRVSLDYITLTSMEAKKETSSFRQVVEEINGSEDEGNVVQLYPTYNGRHVSEEEWRRNLKEAGGCCDWCALSIPLKEAHQALWIGERAVVCGDCKEDQTFLNYMNMERA